MNIEDGVATEEQANGIEAQKNQATINSQPIESDQPDITGGGEDQTNGEDAGVLEETAGAEAESPESKSQASVDLSQFKEEILKEIKETIKPPESAPRQISEEEWAAHEQRVGVPRQAIDFFTRQSVQVYEKLKDYVDQQFASLQKDAALSNVAKEAGITDVARLKPGIDEFLKDFDPRHHNNPALLKKAAIYARGLQSQKDIRTVRNSDEKNRQVVNRLKPGRSEGGSAGNPGQKGLTEQQREVAAMLPGGEAEYMKIKANKNRVIAI